MPLLPLIDQFDDVADAIANPPPGRPIARGVGTFGQKVCDLLSAVPAGVSNLTIAAGRLICSPYWEDKGYSPPIEAPVIPGGQSPVLYNVNFSVSTRTSTDCGGTARTDTTNTPNISITGVLGPITQIKTESTGGTFNCGGALGVILTNGRFSVTGANGTKVSGNIGPTFSQRRFDSAAYSVSIVRQDGQPDTGGNGGGGFGPGANPAPNPGPLPTGTGFGTDPRGQPIIILPPNVTVAPGVTVNIPDGIIKVGGGGGGGVPASEPVPGTPQTGVGNGEGGGENEFPEEPEGEKWIGCCLALTTTAPGLGVIPSSQPNDVYAEVLGNIRLIVKSGSGRVFDTPIQIRSKTVCVWSAVNELQLLGAFVNLKPNFSYTLTPYSIPKE